MTYTNFDYGFTSTDDIKIETNQFPLGKYKVYAKEQESVSSGVKVQYQIVTGANKGDLTTIWYNTKSDREDVKSIAGKEMRRIADATQTAIDSANPIKGRVFGVEVELSKKDDRYTVVKKYFHESEIADDEKSDTPF